MSTNISTPYTVHNFYDTQKLYADDLNEMDTQIQKNDEACRNFNVETINNRINTLRLDTDGTNIILLFDGVEIASVAIADVSSIVFAESLTVKSSLTLNLTAGDTSQITYEVTPNNVNQTVRFRSNDLNVLNVNSSGLITALHLGVTSVSVICGKFTSQIQVTVSEIKTPIWRRGYYLGLDSNNTKFRMLNSSYTRLIAFPTANDNLYLRTGETITITLTSGYINQVFAIFPAGISFDIDTIYNVPIITNLSANSTLDISSNISNNRNLTYTASANCYIAFTVGGTSADSEYTQAEQESFNNDGYCTIEISPAAV